jgi:pyridoxine 5-phosphate synthase
VRCILKIGVNVDHVATLRQARRTIDPDPIVAAGIAEEAGADSIIVHLREDRRHIQDRDLKLLRQKVKTRLNLEMAAIPEMVNIACKVRPDQATLVPERREELTTEGGLDVAGRLPEITKAIKTLQKAGIVVSFFIDPDIRQVKAASRAGAQMVELHTGNYCDAKDDEARDIEFGRLVMAVRAAKDLGLRVSVGHGLTYGNVTRVARIPGVEELNIGHNIVARAVIVGMEKAVREMVDLTR